MQSAQIYTQFLSQIRTTMSSCPLTTSILSKWRAQGFFIRFLDCNTHNCAASNLHFVSLKNAMDHIDDWKVDWDMELSPEEIALVKTPEWRQGYSHGWIDCWKPSVPGQDCV